MLQEILEETGYADEGWETDGLGQLVCPCGHTIEEDGKCPNGCKSPLIELGMI